MKLGVFFERDGVLNQARVERQYQVSPLTLEDFKLNPDAGPLIKRLKAAGFVVIVTTNQPGLSRGYQSRRELDRMHDLLRKTLPVDDLLVCPHDETDRCPCRKPKPGLLVEAGFKWHLSLEHSFVISDKWQGQGIGTELLARLVQIGREEKLERIVADILPDNTEMQRVCEKIGFKNDFSAGEGVVKAAIDL